MNAAEFWSRFPADAASKNLTDHALKGCGTGEIGRSAVPFQFTLPVMAGLFCYLLPEILLDKRIPPDNQPMTGASFIADQTNFGLCQLPNPQATPDGSVPLRAIAYFSWEPQQRVFLTRRVYPTYLDFLSYSHVAEGWGALGIMLRHLEDNMVNSELPYEKVRSIFEVQECLPYLAEASRLQYDSVLALPVCDWRQPDPMSTLCGAVVLYFKGLLTEPIPENRNEHIRSFSCHLHSTLLSHTAAITRANSSLAAMWRDQKHLIKEHPKQILELTLYFSSAIPTSDADAHAARVVRQLVGSPVAAVVDSRSSDPATVDSRSVLIAPADATGEMNRVVERAVLAAVGYAFTKDHPFIRWHCEWWLRR